MKKSLLFSILTFTCLVVSITSFSQNVGVGTTNPLQKLHVEGNSYVKDSLGLHIVKPAATLDVNGTSFFRGNNANTFTDSIRAAVEFFSGRTHINTLPVGLSRADIAFNFGGAGGGFRHFIATRHNNASPISTNGIDFYINNSNTATGSAAPGIGNLPALSVTDIGVGLGKINPYYKIDILGSGSPNQIHFYDTATQDHLLLGTSPNSSAYSFIGTPIQKKFGIMTNSAYRLIVSETGNVGIGTDNPLEKLHVNGNAKVEDDLSVIGTTHLVGNVGIGTLLPVGEKLYVNGDAKMGNTIVAGNAQVENNLVVNGTATVESNFNITGTGNMAIGTTAIPLERLYVNGNAKVETDLTVSGNVNMGYSSNFSDVAVNGNWISVLYLSCPTGQKLLTGGGGYKDDDTNGQYIVINYNGPDPLNSTTRWKLTVSNTGPLPRFVRIHCNCAKIN